MILKIDAEKFDKALHHLIQKVSEFSIALLQIKDEFLLSIKENNNNEEEKK